MRKSFTLALAVAALTLGSLAARADNLQDGAKAGLPPLKWSDLKYGFDHGGEGEWLGNGIVLKR